MLSGPLDAAVVPVGDPAEWNKARTNFILQEIQAPDVTSQQNQFADEMPVWPLRIPCVEAPNTQRAELHMISLRLFDASSHRP